MPYGKLYKYQIGGRGIADAMVERYGGGSELLWTGGDFANGLVSVHRTDDFKEKYPEAFARIGTTRDTDHRGFGTVCYSSEELFDETVRHARYLFDEYNEPHMSIWPGDGFKRCQCEVQDTL